MKKVICLFIEKLFALFYHLLCRVDVVVQMAQTASAEFHFCFTAENV